MCRRFSTTPCAWVLAVLCLAGCAEPDRALPAEGSEEGELVGGRVVSTVEGIPITVDEVARVARITGLEPEEALRRLQRFHLLVQEAERRRFDAHPAVRRAASKAAVQALLRDEVEGGTQAQENDRERFEDLARLLARLESRYGVERHEEAWEGVGGDARGEGP